MCSFCTEGVVDKDKCKQMQIALDNDRRILRSLRRKEKYCLRLLGILRTEPNSYTAKCINSLVKDIQKLRKESIISGEFLESICDEL